MDPNEILSLLEALKSASSNNRSLKSDRYEKVLVKAPEKAGFYYYDGVHLFQLVPQSGFEIKVYARRTERSERSEKIAALEAAIKNLMK